METKLLCQPECQGPSVTRVPPAGNKLVPGAPGEAVTTDALMGAGEGMTAFSEYSLCFWHGTEHVYTQSHFLPTVTLSTEAVITLPR